jgi:membrane protease YdiL (CAAX protease family)
MQFADIFQPILLTILVAAGLLAWAWLLDNWRHGQSVLPREAYCEVPWEGVDVAMTFALWLALQGACISLWTGGHLPRDAADYTSLQQSQFLNGLIAGSTSAVALAAMFIHWRVRASWRDLSFDPEPAGRDVLTGAIAFAAAAPVVFGIQLVLTQLFPYSHPVQTIAEHKPSNAVLALLGLSTILVAPLSEEFIFRVILQGWLEKLELTLIRKHFGIRNERIIVADGVAADPLQLELIESPKSLFGLPSGILPIIGSAIPFALMHLGQGPAPIPLFVLALVLGMLYQRTHRLVPSFTLHLLLNLVSMLMLFTGDPTQPQMGN